MFIGLYGAQQQTQKTQKAEQEINDICFEEG